MSLNDSTTNFDLRSKSEPLGLPRGSVRALLALFVVCSYVVARLVLNVDSAEFAALSGAVITYYFKERSGTNAN